MRWIEEKLESIGLKKARVFIPRIETPLKGYNVNNYSQKMGAPHDVIDVRIIYPRGKRDNGFDAADIFTELIRETILRKEENRKRELNEKRLINEVHTDKHGHDDPEIINGDIVRLDCFVIIVLTKDMHKHQSFNNELSNVQYAINEGKRKNMFLPIRTCGWNEMKQTENLSFMRTLAGVTINNINCSSKTIITEIYKNHIEKIMNIE